MKKPLIALTIGLVMSGCSNSQMMASHPPNANKVAPVEEKLIDSEVIEHHDNQKAEETVAPTTNNNDKKVDGVQVVGNPADLLVVVNKHYTLPENYEPSDLVAPNIPFSFDEDVQKRYVRSEAAKALEQLFAAAKSENIELLGASGYRSYARQEAVFAASVAKNGEEGARKVSAVPGQSEHQTGLAMDVTSKYVGFDVIEEFGETKEGIWLRDNAHKFGFIIRYPKGKEAITGYSYEPWHIRYVGTDAATEIYQKGCTLEEYIASK